MITYQEVLKWLNEYKPLVYNHEKMVDDGQVDTKLSELSHQSQLLKERTVDLLREGQIPLALETLTMLENDGGLNLNSLTRGETWVEAGNLRLELNQKFEQTEAIKKSLSEYPPSSHQHAVCRCLLAINLWDSQNKYDEALIHWNKAIEEFKKLEFHADQDHLSSRVIWYREKGKLLEKNLEMRLLGNLKR